MNILRILVLGGSICRVLRGSEALGSSICRVLRGSEALGGSFVRVLRVGEALGGAQCLRALSDRVGCLLYTSPSPRDLSTSRMPSSA